MNRADIAATIAQLTDVDPATITRAQTVGQLALWTARTRAGRTVAAVLPAMRPATPPRWRRAYMARVEANLTGRCPACKTVVGTNARAEHENSCPVIDPRLARWLETA